MKLNYSISEIAKIINASDKPTDNTVIQTISYDSRKIYHLSNTLFFCLKSKLRDGHDFINDAYQKGIRYFVVEDNFNRKVATDVILLHVKNPLKALQALAQFHREKFHYPVIGITGSTGKTTAKEWLYQLLQNHFKIVRSPKSYNSQIGVALSLLEMTEEYNLAIIEAGISEPREMEALAQMIQPTFGIFTNIGTAHLENFESQKAIFDEKSILFEKAQTIFYGEGLKAYCKKNLKNPHFSSEYILDKTVLSPWTSSYFDLIRLTTLVASTFIHQKISIEQINSLPQLAMRMEVFDGINQNTIINDAYNLDLDALRQSLEFLISSNNRGKTAVLIVANHLSESYKKALQELTSNYPVGDIHFVQNIDLFDIQQFTNTTILIKGYRNNNGQELAQRFKLMKHETVVEIDMDALRQNLNFVRSKIKSTTKTLVMVKAFAYGTDALKIAPFLERNHVDYLGVAYGDEGVALRKAGIKLPILVLNTEPYSYENIIKYNLEPALFSLKSLDNFVRTLINLGKENYPIHLTIDTGMHRLGFNPDEKEQVLEMLKSQPEVRIKGIYTHLADADNFDDDNYSKRQLSLFGQTVEYFRNELPYSFLAHVLNTEGVIRFAEEHQYDMIRLGIGLYGYLANPEMKSHILPVLSWKTIISQIRTLAPEETISYNRKFTTKRTSKIATIPVGYADGLRRSYSQHGEGFVYINAQKCQIVGTICMDMCMVDVTDIVCQEGDEVIIIGKEQTLDEVARQMQTIPYEVLTSISKRVHRVYVNEN